MGFRPPEGSAVSKWLARAVARPSVAETVGEARGFSTEGSGVAEAVAAGLFKREYRDHRLEWMIKSGGVDIVLKGLEAGNIRFTPDFGWSRRSAPTTQPGPSASSSSGEPGSPRNLLGDPTDRRVDVYLPAGSDGAGLPLLVDLVGFNAMPAARRTPTGRGSARTCPSAWTG